VGRVAEPEISACAEPIEKVRAGGNDNRVIPVVRDVSFRNRKRTPVPGIRRRRRWRSFDSLPRYRGRSATHGGRLVRHLRADAHLTSHMADYHNPAD
jgi:hypothetical protein